MKKEAKRLGKKIRSAKTNMDKLLYFEDLMLERKTQLEFAKRKLERMSKFVSPEAREYYGWFVKIYEFELKMAKIMLEDYKNKKC